MNEPAPIVLFAFNRPDHLARTLRALAACPQACLSKLTVYCDGARRSENEAGVSAVRALCQDIRGFAQVACLNGGMLLWDQEGLPVVTDAAALLYGPCPCVLRPRKGRQ